MAKIVTVYGTVTVFLGTTITSQSLPFSGDEQFFTQLRAFGKDCAAQQAFFPGKPSSAHFRRVPKVKHLRGQ